MLDLHRAAREIFADALSSVSASEAVRNAVRLNDFLLRIVDSEFDLRAFRSIRSVAVGKAASSMASALSKVLGDLLTGGVVSSSPMNAALPDCWRVFVGGHPVPNQASLDGARAAFELLRRADDSSSLVIFLVSGGGSAMMELPYDERITLEELREANRVLVSCGASIAEINAVRRCISAVKGGGLSQCAPHAAQVTLIISDTNSGEEATVASGPTIFPSSDAPEDAAEIIARYDLAKRLPASIIHSANQSEARPRVETAARKASCHRHYVLLDNERAIESAAQAARARGFIVEVARDLIEQPVAEGSVALVARLIELRRRESKERTVCLISGGEFACPVRGAGVGGRNSETVLRCAIEMHARAADHDDTSLAEMVALSAGTDGIDGNSPAAGAIADQATLTRAHAMDLDAHLFLTSSDANTFFNALGDAIVTGPTGTNVRDLRIMLAKTKDEG